MTRTKAPTARIVPHIRGKPVTWLTPLPSNRGPTEPGAPRAAVLSEEQSRPPLKRGTNLAVWQSITRRGREPTEARIDPIWSVSRCYRDSQGDIGYRTDHQIRGPNLIANALKSMRGREGPMNNLQCSRPRCQGETRAGDIATKSFICGIRCQAEKVMLPDREDRKRNYQTSI